MLALVTRPREAAAALATALASRQIDSLIEPMMEVRFDEAALGLAGVQAVLCTSANGVRALARAAAERTVPLLAVGEATAARAAAEGFTDIVSAGGDVADLTRLAIERLKPENGPLLHVCGSAVAGDLAGDLGRRGFTVKRRVLYDARPVAALSADATRALRAGEIDVALFFSPRTSAIFARLVKAANIAQCCATVIALSISAAADQPLETVLWRERRIAAQPHQPALVDLLDRLRGERRPA